MPTFAATPATVWLHCRDARCPGSNQEEVEGLREEATYTFGENGGDGAFTFMTESSRVEFKVEDPDLLPCPACSQSREVTGEPRPQYPRLSAQIPGAPSEGFPQDGLLAIQADGEMGDSPKTLELEEKLEKQGEQIAKLLAAIEDKKD